MLAVITDDFTGAAEIAGIVLAKGFTAAIETRTVHATTSDVLVIATNMRSIGRTDASKESARLTAGLMALQPRMIFKKVDSVLRGHIGPELGSMMEAQGKSRALLVPANPSLGRTIEDGIYFVSGTPIAESGFAADNAVATGSSRVVDILQERGYPDLACFDIDDYGGAGDGIAIGNTRTPADVAAWAEKVTDDVVPAGAADFFSALLDRLRPSAGAPSGAPISFKAAKSLYVCGSRFPASGQAVRTAAANGHCVAYVPDAIYFDRDFDPDLIEAWAEDVVRAFERYDDVILFAPQSTRGVGFAGSDVTRVLARCVARVFDRAAPDELMIEGGATAQAVMEALNIETLLPVQALSAGVTRMRVAGRDGLHVTMKPGSYSWPSVIWKFDEKRL
ncbi:uncharacterized protein YgbK (DUF1537 family) [Hephaestia caeni]|uniref:Uncharacterized protein YgbK (DUF1537 family) n=1 Tax=Hephaestia caeni TaxID=645617 RepID=A0A397PC67_9SPHN|nr:four-carbon acid sugar kinase family protein [Hephaestia caeni]RIA45539.1 uncharacterized protein YgbK (DUF1537 family) [Hephaestia caeni]